MSIIKSRDAIILALISDKKRLINKCNAKIKVLNSLDLKVKGLEQDNVLLEITLEQVRKNLNNCEDAYYDLEAKYLKNCRFMH